jgi:quinolinate synthase
MAMNSLESLAQVMDSSENEVFVDPEIARQAIRSLSRMLDFRATQLVA